MAHATGQPGEPRRIGSDGVHAGLGGTRQQLLHARVAARGIDVKLDDGSGGGFQPRIDGVKAAQQLQGSSHGKRNIYNGIR